MVLIFEEFRNQKITKPEKNYVETLFKELENPKSKLHSLQILYNNGAHFTTTNHSLCETTKIKTLCHIAFSTTEKLIIMGNVHHNNHTSGVLLNNSNKPVFVQDTYVKVRLEDGSLIHILVDVPKLQKMEVVTYKRPKGCDFTPMILMPGIK